MSDTLLWLITVEALGLAAFPLAYYLFPSLADRGFCISKPLGILLVGYASWLLSVLRLAPSSGITVGVLLLALAALSAKLFWDRRGELRGLWERERTALIAGQAVYLAVFAVWVVYRSYDPAIDNTEQPMDFMYLNASVRADVGAPDDPWLRGESVSYYYFGYWVYGALTKLTSIPSQVSFNLALALIPAMGAMGAFGLVYNMARAESQRFRRALVGGIAAAVMLVGVANLEGVLEFGRANGIGSPGFYEWTGIDGLDGPAPELTQSWKPDEFWWWWRASRVIGTKDGERAVDYTIAEFPFFSFMLGDLHPHVMSIPLVLLFLTACYGYLRSPPGIGRGARAATAAFLGLALGGLGFTNMWDLPVFTAVFLGVAALKSYTQDGPSIRPLAREALPTALLVVSAALLSISPYLLSFTSQVSGIDPVVSASTRPLHIFIVWGLFLLAVVPYVLSEFWRTTVDEDWAALLWISLAVGFVPFAVWIFLQGGHGGTTGDIAVKLAQILPFALMTVIAVYTLLWLARRGGGAGRVFALGLSALGLLLIMGPELLYVDDSFGGASERMNTVFKLYYQAWIVLAAASGFAVYYWTISRDSLTGHARLLTSVWGVAFVLLLMGSSYYPPAAAASKANLFAGDRTLDGLAHLDPFGSEYRAIMFLRREAGPNSAVLEAVGGGYSSFGRISGSTGVPTVLGWPGHELQWRGSNAPLDGRETDVRRIYQTLDEDEAQNLLDKYAVDYVYVGNREREAYGPEGLAKFSNFMDRVFAETGVEIYRSRG